MIRIYFKVFDKFYVFMLKRLLFTTVPNFRFRSSAYRFATP